mgnify:CR=1 FL=1
MGRAFEYRKARKMKRWGHMARVFTKIGKEMAIAVKAGGPDPTTNSKLAQLIAKAKANNIPKDNIQRAIQKGLGGTDGANYEELTYEGYGPSGIAVIVETLTDNRNRTAGEMRHYFDKCGGNLGQAGSVLFMFDRKGQIIIEAEDLDEDTVMMDAIEAGAEDFKSEEDVFEIVTAPNDMGTVRDALEEKGYAFISAEVAYIPQTMTALSDDESVAKMEKLIDMLEENDDVQEIWHNWDMPEE